MELLLGCLKVFLCRILDVTLGSIKTVLVVRERPKYAAIVGFCEVFIWYLVVRDALNFEGNVLAIAFAYAAGYAAGTYIGGTLASKLIGGHITVHVITTDRTSTLPDALREAGYAISVLDVHESRYGDEKLLILADFEKHLTSQFEALVREKDPHAFVIVQEEKAHMGGMFKRPGK